GLPMMAGYCASKAGVSALFEALRVELTPLGIDVTIVCPGWIRTPLTSNIAVPQPYMMEVDYAAARILAAIRQRRTYLVFPPQAAGPGGGAAGAPALFQGWRPGAKVGAGGKPKKNPTSGRGGGEPPLLGGTKTGVFPPPPAGAASRPHETPFPLRRPAEPV